MSNFDPTLVLDPNPAFNLDSTLDPDSNLDSSLDSNNTENIKDRTSAIIDSDKVVNIDKENLINTKDDLEDEEDNSKTILWIKMKKTLTL